MTTLSTKGQVILPKSVRTQRKWKAGQRFHVEDTPEGVLLRPESLFPPTRYEDVRGSAGYTGPVKNHRGHGSRHRQGSAATPCSRSILTSSSGTRRATREDLDFVRAS